MYNVSTEYKQAANLQTRESRVYGTLTLKNGTKTNFTSADILLGSLSIDNAAVNGQELNLGTVYAAKCQFSLKTEADRYSLYDAEVKLTYSLKLKNGTWEDVPLGIFYVSEAKRTGKYISITAYDAMLNFDRKISTISSGTPYDLLNLSCRVCGVELEHTRDEIDSISPGEYLNGVNSPYGLGIPADNNISTYRDLISEVAVILGGFCIIGRTGKLKICKFGAKQNLNITDRLRKTAEIYDYKCEYSGITANINNTNKTIGTDEKIVLDIGKINLLQNGLPIVKQKALENIWNSIKDLSYTPCTVDYIGDPALDLGDVVQVSGYNADNTSGTYTCIMTYNWKFHGTHKLTAVGKNTKLAKAQNIKSTKTTSNMNQAASEAKTKTLIYTNSNASYIYGTEEPIISFDIPVVKDTSVMINGQIVFEVYAPGTFKLIYEVDGERIEYSPKQTMVETGYCTMNILYALTEAKVDKHNNFTVYIETNDGEGSVEEGNCIIIASGYDIAAITDNTKKIKFEENMEYINIPMIAFDFGEDDEDIETDTEGEVIPGGEVIPRTEEGTII